jgi:hypothetical protein
MVLFAFSVQGQVEKYGAYVGIAAFFGLAVLSLLYFSQARELKRLREWAGRAPERARELEQRVVAQATATVARRAPAMPGAPAKPGMAPPRRLAEMPAPPAAQTAAGTQATEVAEAADGDPATNGNVPAPPVGPGGTVPAGPPANGAVPSDATQAAPSDGEDADAGDAAATPDGARTDGDAAPAGAAATPDGARTDGDAAPAGAAAPAAAAAAGPEAPDATVPGEIPAAPAVPRATPAQRVGVTPRPQPAPLRQPTPSATPRAAGRRPTPPGRRPGAAKPPREGRSGGTIALLVGLAVLILGGGTFLVSQLVGGDEEPTTPNTLAPPPTQTEEPATGGGSAAEPSPPAETNVAVLNGTTFTGLAGDLADQIAGAGYQKGVVETNTRDQTIEASIVYYADGERATARAVARLLSIENVEPLDPETESLAPDADIVVLAGADQAP